MTSALKVSIPGLLASVSVCALLMFASQAWAQVSVKRLLDAPIIEPSLDQSLGANIQGPSLIRVPDWIENPLGKYYLYFADHKGEFIRLAYADELTGPWQIHRPGTLRLDQTRFPQEAMELEPGQLEAIKARFEAAGFDVENIPHDLLREITTPHIASPDVHVDPENQRIVMYFHGLKGPAVQVTRVATSEDGLRFTPKDKDLGKTYFRAFPYRGMTYALAMPGQFYRSEDPLGDFEAGPLRFNPDMRHAGLYRRGDTLYVFWTQVGEAPERILLSTVDLAGPWMEWRESAPQEILRPQRAWEGANAPLEPSMRSVAYGLVNQLRDPYIFEEEGRLYLLYVVGGESGIAIAEIDPATLPIEG